MQLTTRTSCHAESSRPSYSASETNYRKKGKSMQGCWHPRWKVIDEFEGRTTFINLLSKWSIEISMSSTIELWTRERVSEHKPEIFFSSSCHTDHLAACLVLRLLLASYCCSLLSIEHNSCQKDVDRSQLKWPFLFSFRCLIWTDEVRERRSFFHFFSLPFVLLHYCLVYWRGQISNIYIHIHLHVRCAAGHVLERAVREKWPRLGSNYNASHSDHTDDKCNRFSFRWFWSSHEIINDDSTDLLVPYPSLPSPLARRAQ